jgi:phage tail sheath gpL-like
MDQVISFDEIPYDWRAPGAYLEIKPDYSRRGAVPFMARGILFVQKLAAGTAITGRLYEITRAAEGVALFGAGSIGARMVASFRKANRTNRVYAVALADLGGGVQATGKFVFTGSGDGMVSLYVGGIRARFATSSAQTNPARAAAAVAAINAISDMEVVASQGAGAAENEVILTARHKGECGNAIDLRVGRFVEEAAPAGLTVAVTTMSGGVGNPDIQGALDAIVNEWFTDIVTPWDDAANLAKLVADMTERYKAMGNRDVHGFVGHRGTYGQLGTKGALTNSPFLTPIGAKASMTPPWDWAASLAGVAMFHLTNDPARQLRSLVLPGVIAPDPKDQFTLTERDLLLRQGISTWTALEDGTVVLDRVITTYKTSSLGVADDAWLDIMVPKTMTRIRYDWASYFTLMYPRHKLAQDDAIAAQTSDVVVTPKRAQGSWAARCNLYERLGWIEGAKETVARSVFVIDANDRNRLNARQPLRIIGNMMVLAAGLQFEA